eukprot:jgi/Mesen1/4009/ME000211S03188
MARSRRAAPARPPPRAAPRPAATQHSPPPAPVHHAAPPATQQGGGGMLGGMMGMIGQGLAFGGGSAVAHRAVDAVMGPRTVQHEHVQSAPSDPAPAGSAASSSAADACKYQAKAFQDCVSFNEDDVGKCQFYVNMLKECRQNASGAATIH